MLLAGCIFQPQPVVAQGTPYPAPNAQGQQEQRPSKPPQVAVTPVPNGLDVTLQQPMACRGQTPMVRDIETKRSANVWEQILNGSGLVLVGGAGAIVLASPCTASSSDATPSNPNPPSQPCTSSQDTAHTAIGATLVGLGVLAGAAFVYNVIQAHDSTETVSAGTSQSDWTECGAPPLANVPVRLVFGDGQQLAQTTDASGHVRFDLSSVRWTDGALQAGRANLGTTSGQSLASIDLSGLPQYRSWSQARGAQQAVAQEQANAQVERGVIQDCLAKLNAILVNFEGVRNSTDAQAAATVAKLTETMDHQCGLIEKVKVDPGFGALVPRIEPILARSKRYQKQQEEEAARKEAERQRWLRTPAGRRATCIASCNSDGETCGWGCRDSIDKATCVAVCNNTLQQCANGCNAR